MDLISLLLLFLLSVSSAAVIRDVDQHSESKLGSIVYDLKTEHDQQVPELNAGDLSGEDDSVLKTSEE